MERLVPFFTLDRQYEKLSNEVQNKINNVIKKGVFILGDEVRSFEESLKKYCSIGHHWLKDGEVIMKSQISSNYSISNSILTTNV